MRQETNRKILELLSNEIEKYPDIRFIQALWALDIINMNDDRVIEDRFYEEPEKTLEKIWQRLEKRT